METPLQGLPLVAHAGRESVQAREAASDAAVRDVVHAAPRANGRLLLHWGAVRRDGTRLPHAVAATLGHPRQLKRRLLMLHTTTDRAAAPRRWRRWLPLAAAVPVVLALLPIRLVAAPVTGPGDGPFSVEPAPVEAAATLDATAPVAATTGRDTHSGASGAACFDKLSMRALFFSLILNPPKDEAAKPTCNPPSLTADRRARFL